MNDVFFFYGTLCHDPLLTEVLGHRPQVEPATLAGYDAHLAVDHAGHVQSFPILVPAQGHAAQTAQVTGILARLNNADVARLDFYEAGYKRETVTVISADHHPVQAQVYLPDAERFHPGEVWNFDDWHRDWAPIATLAAREYMGLQGVVPLAQAVFRYPMILVRAASRLRAQATSPAHVRYRPAPGDVIVDNQSTGYAKFFAVEDYTLRHRRFSGQMTAPLGRAVFVSGDATAVLPYDPVRDTVLLIEQFRAGIFARGDTNPWSLEAIAGRVDAGESPEQAALREAGEEAGLSIRTLIPAPNFYASPGAKTEYLYSFIGIADLGEGSARPGGLEEEGEDIRPHLIPFQELMSLVDSGEAENGPLLVLALTLLRLRPGLRHSAGVTTLAASGLETEPQPS